LGDPNLSSGSPVLDCGSFRVQEDTMQWLLALFITVFFDGTAQRCLVDTGASHTVVTQEIAARIPQLSQPVHAVHLISASGNPIAGILHVVPQVRTQHFSWNDVVIVVVPSNAVDTPASCVLGMNLLGRQPLWLDWANEQIRPVPSFPVAGSATPEPL
jgi:predicted aspartyl protease